MGVKDRPGLVAVLAPTLVSGRWPAMIPAMSTYDNATIHRAANVYFDGKVTSRTVITSDGERVTLGIMLPGSYEFGTEAAERMEFTAGEVRVLLPGSDAWQTVRGGEAFEVGANTSFKIEVVEIADYCCRYLADC